MTGGPPLVETDVAVVGAGPVGLLLALLLGRRGWRVEILERQAAAFGRPRAVHLDHEAARILQNAGIMDRLAPRTEVMDSYLWRNATAGTLLWPDGGADVPTVSGWPASSMFYQPDLEQLLAEAVSGQPTITVRPGHEVTDVEPDSEGAYYVRAAGPGGAADVRARWVIGCDGADSRVRSLAGLDVLDLDYQAQWLIVDVSPAEPTRWSPLNIQVCDPARPTTAVSGGPGRRRFEFMRLPSDRDDDFGTAASAWRLLQPWGLTPANAALERHATYTFAARLVEKWRRGRMLVAGDAAHQIRTPGSWPCKHRSAWLATPIASTTSRAGAGSCWASRPIPPLPSPPGSRTGGRRWAAARSRSPRAGPSMTAPERTAAGSARWSGTSC